MWQSSKARVVLGTHAGHLGRLPSVTNIIVYVKSICDTLDLFAGPALLLLVIDHCKSLITCSGASFLQPGLRVHEVRLDICRFGCTHQIDYEAILAPERYLIAQHA